MAYTLPKIDYSAEIKKIRARMDQMRAQGKFDHLPTYEELDDSMTIEEAWSYYNDKKYQKDAQFNEESLRAQGICEDAIHEVMATKKVYEKAVETLKKAGEI